MSGPGLFLVVGRIAQLVEQLTLNQRVAGSSPAAPTKFNRLRIKRKSNNQRTAYWTKFATLPIGFATFPFRSCSFELGNCSRGEMLLACRLGVVLYHLQGAVAGDCLNLMSAAPGLG